MQLPIDPYNDPDSGFRSPDPDPNDPDAYDDRDDQEPSATRPFWQPIYMGEGIPDRCANCYRVKQEHELSDEPFGLFCYESFARAAHGDR